MLCTAWFIFYMVKMLRASGEADGQVQAKIIEKTVSGIEQGHLSLRGAMAQFAHSSGAQKFLKGRLEASLLENSETKEEVRRMCKLLIPFFKNYDSNGDGQVSREEFRMILKDLRENMTVDTQSRLFNIADADNSGSISFEEFVVVIMVFALDPSEKLKAKDIIPMKSGHWLRFWGRDRQETENIRVDGGIALATGRLTKPPTVKTQT
jgi:hypothetical protein